MLREDVMLQRMPHMRAQAGKAAAEVRLFLFASVSLLPQSLCCPILSPCKMTAAMGRRQDRCEVISSASSRAGSQLQSRLVQQLT